MFACVYYVCEGVCVCSMGGIKDVLLLVSLNEKKEFEGQIYDFRGFFFLSIFLFLFSLFQ